jgi:hypothetical protein
VYAPAVLRTRCSASGWWRVACTASACPRRGGGLDSSAAAFRETIAARRRTRGCHARHRDEADRDPTRAAPGAARARGAAGRGCRDARYEARRWLALVVTVVALIVASRASPPSIAPSPRAGSRS